MKREEKYMQEAIALADRAINNNEGGPFGCVIVKDDNIVGRGNNKVTSNNDPTAHAEIVAIREACKNLGTFQLEGCELYTSCEPCPMCLGAIYWARPEVIYYANSKEDAKEAGFDDSMIYEEMKCDLKDRKIPIIRIDAKNAKHAFEKWEDKNDRKIY